MKDITSWFLMVVVFIAGVGCMRILVSAEPDADPEISNTDYSLLDSYIRDSPLAKAEACKALRDGKITWSERKAIYDNERERTRVAAEAKTREIKARLSLPCAAEVTQ